MKKVLKWILVSILVLLAVIILYVRFAMHESRPEKSSQGNADELAQKMLSAINIEAWDTIKFIAWTFPGDHNYVWDRIDNHALISWENYEVHIDLDEVNGKAFSEGKELEGKNLDKAIQEAWKMWCNDSFWLGAPFKVFDPGTTRYLAKDKDDKEGLLISYESGGVTPGDEYLWFLDENGLPTGYKMWVKIIPIGGVYASWDKWITLAGGAKISTEHAVSLGDVQFEITNIRSGQNWVDIGLDEDPINL